jgi:hypothetical protein
VTLARDEHSALGPLEVRRLGQPDVGQQLGHPCAARPRSDPAGERLRADERRPRRTLLPARRDEHSEITEAGLAGPLDQAQGGARVGGDERRGPPGQRGGHGPLVAGVDLEQRQREPLAFLRERSGCGRQALTLGERVLQRGQPLAHEPGLLPQGLALRVRACPGQQRLGAQPVAELARSVAPQLEPLDGAAQPVERGGRPVPAARCGRELLLDTVPLREQRLEPLTCALALQAGRRAPLLDLRKPFVDPGQVELGQARP